MDQFVGNTLEKAITRRRRAQREAMAAAAGATKEAVMTYGELRLGQTATAAVVAEPDKTVTVTKIPSHTLKVTTPGGSLVVNGGGKGSGHGHGQNGQTCSTCIASGESSCSSALSSLESVRSSSGYSQGPRSSNSGCSETLGSELHLSPKNDTLYEQTRGGGGQQQQDPAARAVAMSAAVTAAAAATAATAAASQRPPKPMRNQQHFNRNYYHGNGNNGHLLGGGGGGMRIVPATAHQSGSEPTVQGGGLHYDTMASTASKPYQTLEMVDYVTAAEVDSNQNGEQCIFFVQLLLPAAI